MVTASQNSKYLHHDIIYTYNTRRHSYTTSGNRSNDNIIILIRTTTANTKIKRNRFVLKLNTPFFSSRNPVNPDFINTDLDTIEIKILNRRELENPRKYKLQIVLTTTEDINVSAV